MLQSSTAFGQSSISSFLGKNSSPRYEQVFYTVERMKIGQWVRAARTSKKLTQAQLGEALGRTKANVGHWETNKHSPSYDQIVQISSVTGYPMPDAANEGVPTQAQVQDPASQSKSSALGSDRSPTSPEPLTVAATLARLRELLERAAPETQTAVVSLVGQYVKDPSGGSRIAQAIELLLKESSPDGTSGV